LKPFMAEKLDWGEDSRVLHPISHEHPGYKKSRLGMVYLKISGFQNCTIHLVIESSKPLSRVKDKPLKPNPLSRPARGLEEICRVHL
jgi:hypothetical protein